MLEYRRTRLTILTLLMTAGLAAGPGVLSRAAQGTADIDAITKDLIESGAVEAGGESVVRRLVEQGLEPGGDDLYVALGLKLYELGQDKASAAVLVAHHLKGPKDAPEQTPALPSAQPLPTWKPTHKVKLVNGQIMKGVLAEQDAGTFWLETEMGARIRLDYSETISVEPLQEDSGA